MRRRFYVFGLRANIDVGKTRHLSWQNKYFVAAYDKNGNILASSKTIHVATSGGKKGNTKAVKLNKKKATLKKGKTVKLKATLKNGKLKVSKHRIRKTSRGKQTSIPCMSDRSLMPTSYEISSNNDSTHKL